MRFLHARHGNLSLEPSQRQPPPGDTEIRAAISGNLCRCTGYNKIVDAIAEASRRMQPEKKQRPR